MTARSQCSVDLAAVGHNVRFLRARARGAELCAVVKANGYGHGDVPVAQAALAAGARYLAVAQVDEGRALRAAGIVSPIWLLSEPAPNEWAAVAEAELVPMVYRLEAIEAAARSGVVGVHLKIDTGMGRVGCVPEAAVALAQTVADHGLRLVGTCTHLALADAPERPETARQLQRFDAALDALTTAGLDPGLRHAANSAATITNAGSHYDVVRCGIALHGLPPDPGVAPAELRPTLRWTSSVSYVKPVAAGTPLSYGHRASVPADTVVATVPVGYADGVPRGLWQGGGVEIGERWCPIVGVVTMDQLLVDVGPQGTEVGAPVTLIDPEGDPRLSVAHWAQVTGTISYDITCGIGPRAQWSWGRS